MFSYYSQWIENFSEKVRPLVQAGSFPMSKSAKQAFKDLKAEVVESVVHSLDESILFVIEADQCMASPCCQKHAFGRRLVAALF